MKWSTVPSKICRRDQNELKFSICSQSDFVLVYRFLYLNHFLELSLGLRFGSKQRFRLSYAALHRWWDQPFRLCSQLTERGLPSVTIKPCNSTVNEIFMFLRARVNKWHGKIPTTSRNDIIIFLKSSTVNKIGVKRDYNIMLSFQVIWNMILYELNSSLVGVFWRIYTTIWKI